MKYVLRPYQEVGRDFLRARKFAMLGDAPGVGKTGQAIMGIDPLWRTLVVCPATIKIQWQKMLYAWPSLPLYSQIIENGFLQGRFPNIFIVNYELMIRQHYLDFLLRREWDLIIFDEAHKLKSLTAKRTKVALGQNGLRSRAKRIWFLTGTPIKNRTIDLYPILRSCAPECLGPYQSYLKFAYRYCGAYQGRFGMDTSGASHTEELRERLKSFMLRREKRDVLTDLPPRVISKIDLECTPTVKKLIQEEEQKTMEQAGEDDPANFKLGEIARIRQVLAKHKVPVSVEYIKDLLETEEKIVVFYYHKEVLRELQKAFSKIPGVYIDGSIDPSKRRGLVESFTRRKDVRLFFGQMGACGEGIDGLQAACGTCVFVEPSWSHTDIEQCIGRLERSGQRSDVNVHILVIKDTLESRMMEVVKMKLNVDQKLYNQQGENQMAKAVVKKQDVKNAKSETTVEQVIAQALLQIVGLLGRIEDKLNDWKYPKLTSDPAPQDPPVKVRKMQPEPEPEHVAVEVDDEDEVTLDAVRARAGDICELGPNHKADVVHAIKTIGGGKIADLKTPKLRKLALKELDRLYEQACKDLNGNDI